ncbi:MAG: MBOAT family protein [Leadbetterella sp.]|nr:MBOAT family protein [Leadbetterella sp.]
MLFNSVSFGIFLPIVFFLYWFVFNKKLNHQNLLLLVASYFFYGCWDYRFLFLLMFSTFLDYYSGIKIFEAKTTTLKKTWLWISIGINLGFLGLFKYYNFFMDSLAVGLSAAGVGSHFDTLKIILPIGISFYTFHGLSYVIDIYKDKIKPERDFVEYSVFVSFFPLLVAGPIERATHLLPQIQKKRVFDYAMAVDGSKQILWGLFKKIVIADNCAQYANMFFNNSEDYGGSSLYLGALFFTFQIYCDFSGYSDVALGTARLFGMELLRNFAFPYFSRDIAEFWRRWHISLSTWFRDYLYIPLGGSKGSLGKKIRNTFIIFIVSGFWHGANWTFIIWGAINALLFLPLLISKNNRNNLETVAQGKLFPNTKEVFQMVVTFHFTLLAWVFFRAESVSHAFSYISKIFSASLFTIPHFEGQNKALVTLTLVFGFMVVEWMGREQQFALQKFGNKWKSTFRYAFYYALVAIIFLFGGSQQAFIYFQF